MVDTIQDAGMKNKLVDLDDIELLFETGRALCVSNGMKDSKKQHVKIWLPKSLVDYDGKVFTMPEWLAFEKGLI